MRLSRLRIDCARQSTVSGQERCTSRNKWTRAGVSLVPFCFKQIRWPSRFLYLPGDPLHTKKARANRTSSHREQLLRFIKRSFKMGLTKFKTWSLIVVWHAYNSSTKGRASEGVNARSKGSNSITSHLLSLIMAKKSRFSLKNTNSHCRYTSGNFEFNFRTKSR